jgi:hypothetical protein
MESLLAIMEKFEAEMMTKLYAYQEKMDTWLKGIDKQEVAEAYRETLEAIQKK